MRFDVIYSDPPWKHNITSMGKNLYRTMNSHAHYPTMSTKDLCALPVGDVAAPNCALFLWVLNGFLPPALEVMNAWGFRFVTVPFIWRKITSTGKDRTGLGPYTLPGVEQCWLGIRGEATKIIRLHTGIKQVQSFPVGKHSQKPPQFRAFIEQMTIRSRRLEMFARESAPKWHAFGNQVEGSIAL